MKKNLFIVICILVGFCISVHGDTITLKNIGKDIDLRITGMTAEHISAVILKKDIKSVNMKFESSGNYPDLIFLNVADAGIECKIKEIAEDAVSVLIPTTMISSLKMSFQSHNKESQVVPIDIENKQKITADTIGKEETDKKEEREPEAKVHENIDQEGKPNEIRTNPKEKAGVGKYYRLKTKKAEIKKLDEKDSLPRAETESSPENADGFDSEEKLQEGEETSGIDQKPTEDLQDKAFTKAIEESVGEEKTITQDENLGSVEGKILHSGKPLPDCQVKLQMLEKGGLLSKGYRPVEGAVEFETVTDKDGIYHFMNVSPGLYKLHWKAPSETTWVRRFKMEPDVIVEAGKVTNPKTIETLKRTLN